MIKNARFYCFCQNTYTMVIKIIYIFNVVLRINLIWRHQNSYKFRNLLIFWSKSQCNYQKISHYVFLVKIKILWWSRKCIFYFFPLKSLYFNGWKFQKIQNVSIFWSKSQSNNDIETPDFVILAKIEIL